ncbi:MAG: hypothetical protein AAF333_17200 [Planctomycetota bacterium]
MTTTPRSRFASALIATVCLSAVLLATGCSQDRSVFRSTALQPKAVSIVSIETGNTLWTKDVPAGQQLMIDFDRKGQGGEEYSSPNMPATGMKWELWSEDANVRYGTKRAGGKVLDSGKIDLPGEAITVDVKILRPETATN